MTTAIRKLSLGLVLVTILLIVILVGQIKDARIITTKSEQFPLISATAVNIPLSKTDFILGNPGAPLTVVAFLDFSDEKSIEQYQAIQKVVMKEPKKVRFFIKHYPGKAFFKNPLLIHQSVYCAGKQDTFWEYLDLVAASKRTVRESQLMAFAEGRELAVQPWQTCVADASTLSAIQADIQFAQSLGLPEAPIIFFNNKLLNPEEKIDVGQLLTSFISSSL